MSTQYANGKIINSGLVLALDAADRNSYPGSGTTWSDVSGNGNNGTLTNGPTFSNNSIVFDGTNDFIDINPTLSLNNVSQFSYSSFVNFTSSPAGSSGNTFFSYGVSGTFTNDILFGWFKSTNELFFQINNGADGSGNVLYSRPGQWTNIFVAYNGSLSTNAEKLKVYINSVQATLSFSTYTVPSVTASPTNPKSYIGAYIGFVGGWYLMGNVANTQIYDRALSAQEVIQNYNAQKSRFNL